MKKRLATIYTGLFGMLAALFIFGSIGSSEAQAESIWYTKNFSNTCEFQCQEYSPDFCDCTLHDTIRVE